RKGRRDSAVSFGGGSGLATSADAGRIAIEQGDKILIYDRAERRWTTVKPAPGTARLGHPRLTDDGTILTALLDDGEQVGLWDAQEGQLLGTLSAEPLLLTELAIGPLAGWLAGRDDKGRLCLWDLNSLRRELAGLGLDWSDRPYPATPRPLEPDDLA